MIEHQRWCWRTSLRERAEAGMQLHTAAQVYSVLTVFQAWRIDLYF